MNRKAKKRKGTAPETAKFVGLDNAFKIFAGIDVSESIESYIGEERFAFIHSTLMRYRWRNLFSNYSLIVFVIFGLFCLLCYPKFSGPKFIVPAVLGLIVGSLVMAIQFHHQFPDDKKMVGDASPDRRDAMSALIEFKDLLKRKIIPLYVVSDRDRDGVKILNSTSRFNHDYRVVWILRPELRGIPVKTPFGMYFEGKLSVDECDLVRRSRNYLHELHGHSYEVLLRAYKKPAAIKYFPASDLDHLSSMFSALNLMDRRVANWMTAYRTRLLRAEEGANCSAEFVADDPRCRCTKSQVQKLLAGTYPGLLGRLKAAIELADPGY